MSFDTDYSSMGLPSAYGQNAFTMLVPRTTPQAPKAKRKRIRPTPAERAATMLQSPEEREAAKELRKSEWKLAPEDAADRKRATNKAFMAAKRAGL